MRPRIETSLFNRIYIPLNPKKGVDFALGFCGNHPNQYRLFTSVSMDLSVDPWISFFEGDAFLDASHPGLKNREGQKLLERLFNLQLPDYSPLTLLSIGALSEKAFEVYAEKHFSTIQKALGDDNFTQLTPRQFMLAKLQGEARSHPIFGERKLTEASSVDVKIEFAELEK